MTTAFTAIPMKITTSAMRFRVFGMLRAYAIARGAIIDLDQAQYKPGGVAYV